MNGQELKNFIKDNGISQANLARALDCTPQNIQMLFRSTSLKLSTLKAIAKALNIDFRSMLDSVYRPLPTQPAPTSTTEQDEFSIQPLDNPKPQQPFTPSSHYADYMERINELLQIAATERKQISEEWQRLSDERRHLMESQTALTDAIAQLNKTLSSSPYVSTDPFNRIKKGLTNYPRSAPSAEILSDQDTPSSPTSNPTPKPTSTPTPNPTPKPTSK